LKPGEDPSLSGAGLDYNAQSAGRGAAQAAGPTEQQIKEAFFKPPAVPTQEGSRGIRYDFNDGARVMLPKGAWHVQLLDDESDNILFAADVDEGWVVSTKKYYVPFRIKVWERGQPAPLLDHALDLTGRPVRIQFPVGTLGDLIGWFPYAEKFLQKHGCRLECAMGLEIIDLVKDQYPDMVLSTPDKCAIAEPYATYRVGLFFGGNLNNQPIDFRMVGLHRTAGHILGVDPAEVPPRLKLDNPREIKEPYVCIATKSTCQAKYWNNGFGWGQVIAHLKKLGYRVLCIDRDRTVGQGFVWNQFPEGAEDFTGRRPLAERVAVLQHADFFIGLGSGLSWLAWAARIPVVLISGFSLPYCEFHTPYRVHNTHGCNGCWDAMDLLFDHKDFFWCPRHKGTDRQYECTRIITGKQVIGHIERLRQDHGLKGPLEGGASS
jgi:autotransporter strand-loop-strand O-heptosyltransferase